MRDHRFIWLDAVRCVAALLVLFGHARNIMVLDFDRALPAIAIPFYALTSIGHEAVIVFFVLSGYWITRSITTRVSGNRWSWADYGLDRLSRLWVVLIPALFIGLLFDATGRWILEAPLYLGAVPNAVLTGDVADKLTLPDFIGSALFLQTLLVDPFGTNGPLWSLANEFWYYVWFPALYLAVMRRSLGLALAAALATMIAFPSLLPGFLCWLIGSLLVLVENRAKLKGITLPWLVPVAAAMLFAGMLLAFQVLRFAGPVPDLILAVACGGFFATIILSPSIPLIPGMEILAAYGRNSSYSLYVTHLPLAALLTSLCLDGRLPFGLASLGLFILIAALCIGFGHLFSLLTEQRTQQVRTFIQGRILRPRSRAVPAD